MPPLLRLGLAGTRDDQRHSCRKSSAPHPRGNRVFLRHFRFNVSDFEDTLFARIRRRLDENEKSSRDQDGAQNLQNAHVIPLKSRNGPQL
jgi:hypothetical protein